MPGRSNNSRAGPCLFSNFPNVLFFFHFISPFRPGISWRSIISTWSKTHDTLSSFPKPAPPVFYWTAPVHVLNSLRASTRIFFTLVFLQVHTNGVHRHTPSVFAFCLLPVAHIPNHSSRFYNFLILLCVPRQQPHPCGRTKHDTKHQTKPIVLFIARRLFAPQSFTGLCWVPICGPTICNLPTVQHRKQHKHTPHQKLNSGLSAVCYPTWRTIIRISPNFPLPAFSLSQKMKTYRHQSPRSQQYELPSAAIIPAHGGNQRLPSPILEFS